MTPGEMLRYLHALREDLMVFERKYNTPTEVFFDAYRIGEEPADSAWILDWSEWAATYELLQERLTNLRSSRSRSLLLQQAGALADDETIPDLLASIYAGRGRPEAERGSDG